MRDAEADGNPGGHEGIRKKFNLPDDIGKGDDYIPQPGDEGYAAPTEKPNQMQKQWKNDTTFVLSNAFSIFT